MKKYLFVVIAILAIALTGCKQGNNEPKVDTGTLVVVNGFSGTATASVFEIVNGVENKNAVVKVSLGAKDSYSTELHVGEYRVWGLCGLYYDEKFVTVNKNSTITVTIRK